MKSLNNGLLMIYERWLNDSYYQGFLFLGVQGQTLAHTYTHTHSCRSHTHMSRTRSYEPHTHTHKSHQWKTYRILLSVLFLKLYLFIHPFMHPSAQWHTTLIYLFLNKRNGSDPNQSVNLRWPCRDDTRYECRLWSPESPLSLPVSLLLWCC